MVDRELGKNLFDILVLEWDPIVCYDGLGNSILTYQIFQDEL